MIYWSLWEVRTGLLLAQFLPASSWEPVANDSPVGTCHLLLPQRQTLSL